MPRIEFGDQTDRFIDWIMAKVGKNKYECYVTEKLEVIMHPLKSTKPITYGYYKGSNVEAIKKILQSIKRLGIPIHRCDTYEWNPENPIGSTYEPE